MVILNPINYLPVRTACGSMPRGQTTKLDCGDAALKMTHKLQIQLDTAGKLKLKMTETFWPLTGCTSSQLLMLFLSCGLAHAPKNALQRNVSVGRMA